MRMGDDCGQIGLPQRLRQVLTEPGAKGRDTPRGAIAPRTLAAERGHGDLLPRAARANLGQQTRDTGAVTAVGVVVRGEGGGELVLIDRAPETITPDEMSLGFADHFAALHEQGIFLDEVCSMEDQLSVLGVIAAADHPARWELLDEIAQNHPDRKVAKQARNAAALSRSRLAR